MTPGSVLFFNKHQIRESQDKVITFDFREPLPFGHIAAMVDVTNARPLFRIALFMKKGASLCRCYFLPALPECIRSSKGAEGNNQQDPEYRVKAPDVRRGSGSSGRGSSAGECEDYDRDRDAYGHPGKPHCLDHTRGEPIHLSWY